MSSLSKKIKKRSYLTAYKAGEPPREDDSSPSSSLSLTSLPEEIVLHCLARVPRCYYQNLSRVSKTLRSLVHSRELHRLRSLLPKPKESESAYFSFHGNWFTLCPIEKTRTTTEYRLVSIPIPLPPFMRQYLTIAVGSEIFSIGGSSEHWCNKPSSYLWIFDTRTGNITQGPSMKVARSMETVVEKIDGKIYVIGGCDDEIQVEVFDPKSRSWEVAESPKEKYQWRMMKRLSASSNGKVYMQEAGKIAVYNPRKGRRMETVKMPSDDDEEVWCMCVVSDVLYACYSQQGLMGFDAKRKVWRRVVGLDKLIANFYDVAVTAEYDGKLAVLWYGSSKKETSVGLRISTSVYLVPTIRCAVIALDWIGEVIRGTIEWYGVVTTDDAR